jgi:hypothetical protein
MNILENILGTQWEQEGNTLGTTKIQHLHPFKLSLLTILKKRKGIPWVVRVQNFCPKKSLHYLGI